jgi:hypothetical protein
MSSAGGVTTEPGVAGVLEADHAGIDALLIASVVGDTFDLSVYGAFRGRLLRHIGMEEKILLPFARAAQPEAPLAVAKQLKLDHGALVSLLVPSPTRRLVEQLRALLAAHNPMEEGPDGFYRICARLAGTGEGELLRRLQAAPEVRQAAYYDGESAFANIERRLRATGRMSADRLPFLSLR